MIKDNFLLISLSFFVTLFWKLFNSIQCTSIHSEPWSEACLCQLLGWAGGFQQDEGRDRPPGDIWQYVEIFDYHEERVHFRSPKPPSVSGFARMTHGTSSHDLAQWKKAKQSQEREEVCGWCPEKPSTGCPVSSSSRVTQDKLWQHMWNAVR